MTGLAIPNQLKKANRPKPARPPTWRKTCQFAGSPRIGLGLLVLIGVVMAAATVYEARHTREAAQALFYQAWWFGGLLAALAANILATTLARWPFGVRKIGFPITHLGVLVILGGALATNWFGLEGRLRPDGRGVER